MDATELAEKMLTWEKNKKALDILEKEIAEEVMKIGKTQVVGGCRVTYSGGRNTYDYETAGKTAPKEIIEKYSKTDTLTDWQSVVELSKVDPEIIEECTFKTVTVDYKEVCKEAKINPIVVSTTPSTAMIKLEKIILEQKGKF